jgi:hypothetical protein
VVQCRGSIPAHRAQLGQIQTLIEAEVAPEIIPLIPLTYLSYKVVRLLSLF